MAGEEQPEQHHGATLLPPAVAAIRTQELGAAHDAAAVAPPMAGAIRMERTASSNIRAEGKVLKEAAEDTQNFILDIALDGTMRWASPMWDEVVGLPFESLKGAPIDSIVVSGSSSFTDAIQALLQGDITSRFVRFSVRGGPDPASTPPEIQIQEPQQTESSDNKKQSTSEDADPDVDQSTLQVTKPDNNDDSIVKLDAQGIMIYDRATGKESHTMWMIRPAVTREVTIDLPEALVEVLGDGADLLAQYLTVLADANSNIDAAPHPPPMPVLCRICERQITPWLFPKHTELCVQEYQAEAELQRAQENLTEHRNSLVKVLDGLEALSRFKQLGSPGGETHKQPTMPDYKGLPIGESTNSSGRASPASTASASPPPGMPARPSSGFSHHRARSFTVRRPLSRIVELVLDLCDTALEINPPALKDTRSPTDGEFRTQSPQSENRISQVLQWQSPSAGALDNEPGLAVLCDDTAALCKAKVDATLLFRRVLEYGERIRSEFSTLVQDVIDAALAKAAQIAAGDISSSSSSNSSEAGDEEVPLQAIDDEEMEATPMAQIPEPAMALESAHELGEDAQTPADPSYPSSWEPPSAMAGVFVPITGSRSSPSPHSSPRLVGSSAVSTRSNSPRAGSSTPRSYPSNLQVVSNSSENPESAELEFGTESDISSNMGSHIVRASARARPIENVSPDPEPFQRHRRRQSSKAENTREHKRKSLVLPRATSLTRQPSPGRGSSATPQSPMRAPKPRLPSMGAGDHSRSPIISPTLSSNEFVSPLLQPQNAKHRRQSSEASSELAKTMSPRLSMSNQMPPRAIPPSIKDFEVIKPISKGAFGVVYLAKKKSTGDYYAIKALKKADMVAKNQVANVKAERAILMWQGESDFVAKLYWTFPSKDYIFLVMEYLNGGDCASLLQALGTLPEDWAKKYMAEVVQGVSHLHEREIVHRDLKPDNLLIDQKGRLKLTDFGLSRMGLIGRQKRALNNKNANMPSDPLKNGPFPRSTSIGSSRSASLDTHAHQDYSPAQTPAMTPVQPTESGQPSYFSLSRDTSRRESARNSGLFNESPDSDILPNMLRRLSIFEDAVNNNSSSHPESAKGGDEGAIGPAEEPSLQKQSSNSSGPQASKEKEPASMSSSTAAMPPPPMALFEPDDNNRRFVGTPDYLAPETINGLGQDEMSDWWSMGCIMFEFLFGYPPFHADTPARVFEKILSRDINWPEDDEIEVSPDAKDLMNRLMCLEPDARLGVNGTDEIRKHPWFADIDWATLNEAEASFIPTVENPEDTEYFDARGASAHDFAAEFEDQISSPALTPSTEFERPHDALSRVRTQVNSMKRNLMPLHIPPHVRDGRSRRLSEPVATDDFGQFSFKNLPVLEKANKDVIQKLRAEAMQAQTRAGQPTSAVSPHPPPALESSPNIGAPVRRAMSISKGDNRAASPSLTHSNSSPSRISQPPSPMVQFSTGMHHERRKTSSGSIGLPQPLAALTTTHQSADQSRFPATLRSESNAASPVKTTKPGSGSGDSLLPDEPQEVSRTRSHTIGSSDNDGVKERISSHYKRRSQVLDISPSSSDTEDPRQKALLRVQRRRQSSRRMSQINLTDAPIFRPLDILVCEDHPVSRIVIERLLDKLKCRAIIVADGGEALRYATSSVKFDVIMLESKLPQINGADVARMIRETKNANCHTPIIAVTGYLKEVPAPHHFDALIEKPATVPKLTEIFEKFCQWIPPPPGWMPPQLSNLGPSHLRHQQYMAADDSPTTTTSSSLRGIGIYSSSYGRGSSREDSLSSASVFTDDTRSEDANMLKQGIAAAADDWSPVVAAMGGLGISDSPLVAPAAARPIPKIPALVTSETAPADLEHAATPSRTPRKSPSAEQIDAKRRALGKERPQGGEIGDDEDEELGNTRVRSRSPGAKSGSGRPTSKLGTEMLRTDSQGSVVSIVDQPAMLHAPIPASAPAAIPAHELCPRTLEPLVSDTLAVDGPRPATATTPPELFPRRPGSVSKEIESDLTPKPDANVLQDDGRREELRR